MDKFTSLTAIAAPLDLMNIDTDMIIPKQFLKTIKRTGLGIHAFDELRYNEDGSAKPDFVLNQEPYSKAQILITKDNFGCGSSREHAPWALLDFGLRCIIAPSYADIFYNNCFKNGILPIQTSAENVDQLMDAVKMNKSAQVSIDLDSQTVKAGNISFEFDIDSFRKHCLLNGLDDIGLTLEKNKELTAFESSYKAAHPWV
jgi:3-isopropylmalate/(R)-2-methylmalate dehydratase small subunit|tara:strand:+ start:465 stop:1067 length:603 start_codon:yes stop_codon:yes gene_type:complete